MDLPSENLTFGELGTLAGLSVAVWILVTALRSVVPTLPAKVTALGLAVLLSVGITVISGQAGEPQAMLLAVVNGALAALVASGGSLVVEGVRSLDGSARISGLGSDGRRGWWRAWR